MVSRQLPKFDTTSSYEIAIWETANHGIRNNFTWDIINCDFSINGDNRHFVEALGPYCGCCVLSPNTAITYINNRSRLNRARFKHGN